MTIATEKLIEELAGIVDVNKYLLISGGTASGKTYAVGELLKKCELPQYNAQGQLPTSKDKYEIIDEHVQIHPSFSYDDFVAGISISASCGTLKFEYQDKLFLNLLSEANEAWISGESKKFFLVIEDVGRSNISGILGDVLPLLETHGNSSVPIVTQSGKIITVPPNFYIVATLCTTIENINQSDYGFFRHFYHKYIEATFAFMDNNSSVLFGEYEISPNAMFQRSKRIVNEHLRYRHQMSPSDRDRYVIGHGVFKEPGITRVVRSQVLPTLKQYLKDGILDRTAKAEIDVLERLVTGTFTKDYCLADNDTISGCREDVVPSVYYEEALTHRPIVNLLARIKTQGLLNDSDIVDTIIFNPGVLVRKSTKIDGVNRTYPSPAYLFIERSKRDIYIYGTTKKADGTPKRPRFFYSSKNEDIICINGIEYASASEMQPKEYTRWSEDLNSEDYINERASSSPNSIMFRILRSYYKCLEQNFSAYLTEYPDDENIRLLREYARTEFEGFIHFVRRIGSGSDEANVNLERNRQFRERISQLTLLWKNRGSEITWNGQKIKVEGVYKVSMADKYKEYAEAMKELGIHQMILQGPPGTSKTYSAREFLKYMGSEDGENLLSEQALGAMQISSYKDGMPISEWERSNGRKPKLAWDIVQFHPSYGYEDFVRGIEVTTINDAASGASSISYDTVNKTLGKIAELASRPGYEETSFVLVVDEINRANLATVFGELIYGLEYRGRSVATPYTVGETNKVSLNPNLYILGTMNTADKSIGGIDYAIRRRFLFFSLLPDKNVILSYNFEMLSTDDEKNNQTTINEKSATLFEAVEKLFELGNLNAEYYKDDIQIGHTYFLVSSEEQLFLRFKYQIVPILREYYKDGMFQFDGAESDDGFGGLIDLVSGQININGNDERIREIFDKLISKE